MISFTDYIDVRVFFISFFVGVFILYFFAPNHKYVTSYPPTDNSNQSIYKEKENQCFKYEVKEINCPQDKSQIHSMNSPIPENNPVIQSLQKILSFDS
jgi:hypothetical protein